MSADTAAVLADAPARGPLLGRQLVALIAFSLREARHKWTLVATFVLTTLFLIVLASVVSVDVVEGTISSARLMGGMQFEVGGVPVGDVVLVVQTAIAGTLSSFGLLLALFVTGNVIPRTLSPGWVDLLVAQPLSRPTLVIGRSLGAIVMVAIGLAYLILGSWAILTWKTGFGNAGFLSAGAILLFNFAVCYAGMVLVGVVTRSSPVSIIAGVGIWFLGWPLYALHRFEEWKVAFEVGWRRNLAGAVAESLYQIFPKSFELSDIVLRMTRGESTSFTPALASLPFAFGCLALACWWFSRQDY